jgi:hypothetical protein
MICKSFFAASLLLATALVAGCGNDGNIGAVLPGDRNPEPEVIVGGVLAPNGQWVSAESLLGRFASLFVAPAHALAANVVPIGAGVPVTLYSVFEADAADGQIDSAMAVSSPQPTDPGGRFTVALLEGRQVGECGLMLSVGTGSRLTRAFVFTDDQDLDAVSEAVVRSILNFIAEDPGVLLCDYDADDLFQIDDLIRFISADTTGTSVADINQRVYQQALDSPSVQSLLGQLAAP